MSLINLRTNVGNVDLEHGSTTNFHGHNLSNVHHLVREGGSRINVDHKDARGVLTKMHDDTFHAAAHASGAERHSLLQGAYKTDGDIYLGHHHLVLLI